MSLTARLDQVTRRVNEVVAETGNGGNRSHRQQVAMATRKWKNGATGVYTPDAAAADADDDEAFRIVLPIHRTTGRLPVKFA